MDKYELDRIEYGIASGQLSAEQVFTKMKHLLQSQSTIEANAVEKAIKAYMIEHDYHGGAGENYLITWLMAYAQSIKDRT